MFLKWVVVTKSKYFNIFNGVNISWKCHEVLTFNFIFSNTCIVYIDHFVCQCKPYIRLFLRKKEMVTTILE